MDIRGTDALDLPARQALMDELARHNAAVRDIRRGAPLAAELTAHLTRVDKILFDHACRLRLATVAQHGTRTGETPVSP